MLGTPFSTSAPHWQDAFDRCSLLGCEPVAVSTELSPSGCRFGSPGAAGGLGVGTVHVRAQCACLNAWSSPLCLPGDAVEVRAAAGERNGPLS